MKPSTGLSVATKNNAATSRLRPTYLLATNIAAHNPPRAANHAYSKGFVGEIIHRG